MSPGELFESLVGQEIAGGCDSCDAVQRIRHEDRIYRVTVMHEDRCPEWRRMRKRAA